MQAKLRVCCSCEWIFKAYKPEDDDPMFEDGELSTNCPKCTWPSYSARYVYGNKAYRYAETQKPWFDRKMSSYALQLRKEIEESSVKNETYTEIQLDNIQRRYNLLKSKGKIKC
jgi:hypothetical protein